MVGDRQGVQRRIETAGQPCVGSDPYPRFGHARYLINLAEEAARVTSRPPTADHHGPSLWLERTHTAEAVSSQRPTLCAAQVPPFVHELAALVRTRRGSPIRSESAKSIGGKTEVLCRTQGAESPGRPDDRRPRAVIHSAASWS